MTYISFTPYFPSPTSVIGPFVYDQVRAIDRTRRFQRIVVLKPFAWYARRLSYSYGGVTVYGVRTFQLPSKILPNLFDAWNRFFFFRRLRQLGILNGEKEMTGGGPIVLHVHTSPLAKYGVWLKQRMPDCRTWLQHHDLDPMLVRMGRLRNCRWHQRLVISERVTAVSQMDLQIGVSQLVIRQLEAFPKNTHASFSDYDRALALVSDCPPVTIHKACVLYNGADTACFKPGLKRGTDGNFRIGCVAGFYESKGQLTLIKAIERLSSQAELVLLGIGKNRAICEAYVREHNLGRSIKFEGVRDHAALADFYRSLDLFVLPSVFEAFGCVYLEAAASGVPFICCRGQGGAEAVDPAEASRWLVNPGDDAQLASLIERFIRERPRQHLAIPFSIDTLVTVFLDKVLSEV